MTRLAILNPASLIGKEVKEALEQRRDMWSDLRLLTLDTEDFGLVSDVGGEATFLQEATPENLEDIDLLFACPEPEEDPEAVLGALDAARTVIFVSPISPPPGVPTVVAGVNLDQVDTERHPLRLVSPHPGAVAVAHLLHPLRSLGLAEAAAWVVQPASLLGQRGIDELIEQTRGLLSFKTDYPRDTFGGQLALNLMPAKGGDDLQVALRSALGDEMALSINLVQGPVFHSITVSALVRCADGTALADVEDALAGSPHIEPAELPETLGPIDASGNEALLTGHVQSHSEMPGFFWLWAVMDNLILGGAGNALAIGETLLGTKH